MRGGGRGRGVLRGGLPRGSADMRVKRPRLDLRDGEPVLVLDG
ncbi:hypothetical protein QJS66_18570 [Kocuria rhizophila]|nr:hypothetical protein QJS66_18570 [Kocuria rhizophila]